MSSTYSCGAFHATAKVQSSVQITLDCKLVWPIYWRDKVAFQYCHLYISSELHLIQPHGAIASVRGSQRIDVR